MKADGTVWMAIRVAGLLIGGRVEWWWKEEQCVVQDGKKGNERMAGEEQMGGRAVGEE